MDLNDFLDQEYENLNNAILQAIVSSEDVQDILERLRNQYHMDDKAVLNLFLSLEELSKTINETSSDPANYKLEPNTPEKPMNKDEKVFLGESNIIDGEILTSNQVLFEKFHQETFNESGWMKKARIRL